MSAVTCHLCFEVEPAAADAFERFAVASIGRAERSGGRGHGYRLPAEGASALGHVLATFPEPAAYEDFRTGVDATFPVRYEETFVRAA